MSQTPILSVIVPSYNMEAYLPKCLGSLIVAPELMERLEVLVVNDGSKDRASEIAHEFASKWPQTFKVIDKENGHYGSCINAALPVFTGKYVRLLDADDAADTSGFATYLRRLEMLDADLVLTDYVMSNLKAKVVKGAVWAQGDLVVGGRCRCRGLAIAFKLNPLCEYARMASSAIGSRLPRVAAVLNRIALLPSAVVDFTGLV